MGGGPTQLLFPQELGMSSSGVNAAPRKSSGRGQKAQLGGAAVSARPRARAHFPPSPLRSIPVAGH
eukprot:6651311-Alexandrium_andersonii.AAC.1